MRTIRQPGPALEPRIITVLAQGRSIAFDLEPGLLLVEAVRRGFAAEGFIGGVVELGAVALGPFAYVMPALSKNSDNAAFYSDIFRPEGITRLEAGAMTFGQRDGAPFFHCHALWQEADGRINGGHLLPEVTVVAERIRVEALGIDGALFEAEPDPETNFKIFGPVAAPKQGAKTDRRVLVVRLRPNQDFAGALEAASARYGFTRARIRGGVGSTIGARFTDGRVMDKFATEVFVREGMIAPGPDGQPRARIEVGLVDYTGAMGSGVFVNGDNPVLMTFEIALEEVSGA